MIAAQQWAAIEREYPDIETDFAEGRFDRVNTWRADRIWTQASRWSTPELIERATDEPLNADHFRRHLEKRYGTF